MQADAQAAWNGRFGHGKYNRTLVSLPSKELVRPHSSASFFRSRRCSPSRPIPLLHPSTAVCQCSISNMSETNPPRVSFSDKDLENGAPNNDRAASRKWSTAPGAIEDLDEYTALQKYISTYRDPKERAAEEAGDGPEAKPKKSWQFWKKSATGGSSDMTVPDEWLEADIRQGISNHDVESRRKKFGFNEISSDKENMFIKFLSFFTGPILYGTSLSPTLAFAFACRSGLGGLH